MSMIHVIAMAANKIDLSSIPKDRVIPIGIPQSGKFNEQNQPKTIEDFRELIDSWDGKLEEKEPEVNGENGDFGMGSNGIVHVFTPDGWHRLDEFRDMHVCKKCFSDDVHRLEWVNINTDSRKKGLEYVDGNVWCDYCKALTTIIPLTTMRNQGGDNDNNSKIS